MRQFDHKETHLVNMEYMVVTNIDVPACKKLHIHYLNFGCLVLLFTNSKCKSAYYIVIYNKIKHKRKEPQYYLGLKVSFFYPINFKKIIQKSQFFNIFLIKLII